MIHVWAERRNEENDMAPISNTEKEKILRRNRVDDHRSIINEIIFLVFKKGPSTSTTLDGKAVPDRDFVLAGVFGSFVRYLLRITCPGEVNPLPLLKPRTGSFLVKRTPEGRTQI